MGRGFGHAALTSARPQGRFCPALAGLSSIQNLHKKGASRFMSHTPADVRHDNRFSVFFFPISLWCVRRSLRSALEHLWLLPPLLRRWTRGSRARRRLPPAREPFVDRRAQLRLARRDRTRVCCVAPSIRSCPPASKRLHVSSSRSRCSTRQSAASARIGRALPNFDIPNDSAVHLVLCLRHGARKRPSRSSQASRLRLTSRRRAQSELPADTIGVGS